MNPQGKGLWVAEQPKRVKAYKPSVSRKPKTKTGVKYQSVGSSWEKKATGRWVGRQSTNLNPGSESAANRRVYRATGMKSRTRKVIRPRIRKQQRRDVKS
jgi:hypothetical protein